MRSRYARALPKSWEPTARIFSALGDPLRQRILLLFEPGAELNIKEIAAAFPVSRTTIVHHLRVLERAQLLAVRRVHRESRYSLQKPPLQRALRRVLDYVSQEV